MTGLAEDGGLYMPERLPSLGPGFFRDLVGLSLADIASIVSFEFLGDDLTRERIDRICAAALTFDAPVVSLSEDLSVLELFHGPTMAFKDFGARFMAQLMSAFHEGESGELTILVATSGDTGSAVASGFFGVPGIRVVVLYPSGRVSEFQEKQITTLGGNISALEINGSFDDCQKLVKTAFGDQDLKAHLELTSANSINIARLIPQSFYYMRAYAQLEQTGLPLVVSVPSGNFGNLTAGLFAKRMGLPVKRFVAATNVNDVVVEYLRTGVFKPRPSRKTLSNAMDVGNPSNFERMLKLYDSTVESMQADIFGDSFSDEQTKQAIAEIWSRFGYAMDPHGAVGYLGFKSYQAAEETALGLVLETAHPCKFAQTVEEVLGKSVPIPERMKGVLEKPKQAQMLGADYASFKEFLVYSS